MVKRLYSYWNDLVLDSPQPLPLHYDWHFDLLRKHFNTQFDDAQSIGRRYRRQDEIGTPYCVTVDFDTLDDQQVTIRDRDTMYQVRIPVTQLVEVLQDKIEHGW